MVKCTPEAFRYFSLALDFPGVEHCVPVNLPFREVVARLVEFPHHAQAQSETIPVIIAHGGHLHNFSVLLASCMKHNWDKFGILTECMFMDSMQILQDGGYQRPGLDALCKELDIKRSSHSALEDA